MSIPVPFTKYNIHAYPLEMFFLLLSIIYCIFSSPWNFFGEFHYRKNAMLSQQNNTDVITLLSHTDRQIKTPCHSLSHYTVSIQKLDFMSFSSLFLTMLFWFGPLCGIILKNSTTVEHSKSYQCRTEFKINPCHSVKLPQNMLPSTSHHSY
jgi:hypothetical protein